MEELLKNKKTFSASGIFMHTKNMVFNLKKYLKGREKNNGTDAGEK